MRQRRDASLLRQPHQLRHENDVHILRHSASRKHAGRELAAQNACLVTINELVLAARVTGKSFHYCVLLGHSFGGLVLEIHFLIPSLMPLDQPHDFLKKFGAGIAELMQIL